MLLRDFFWAGFISLLPIAELRGGIPYAMAVAKAPWYLAFPFCVGINALVAPLALLFLGSLHRLFYKLGWYRRLFDRFVDRARQKVKPAVEKFGYWGLLIFVAIPLPFTGAWTGALGAWVLGMGRRKTIVFVGLGVCIAGIIVTSIMALGLRGFDVFVKRA